MHKLLVAVVAYVCLTGIQSTCDSAGLGPDHPSPETVLRRLPPIEVTAVPSVRSEQRKARHSWLGSRHENRRTSGKVKVLAEYVADDCVCQYIDVNGDSIVDTYCLKGKQQTIVRDINEFSRPRQLTSASRNRPSLERP